MAQVFAGTLHCSLAHKYLGKDIEKVIRRWRRWSRGPRQNGNEEMEEVVRWRRW